MIAAREGDGRFGPSQWVPNSTPGHWDPVAPNGTVVQDPTPWVGGVKPFLMQSSSQFRTAGPNALTSAAYTADFNEVKALGGDGVVTPSARTATQTHNAIFWQSAGGPALLWSGVARNLAEDPAIRARSRRQCASARDDEPERRGRGDQLLERQVPLRLLAAVSGDPQGGGPADGNPDTSPDLTWTPLLSAPYPDHTSGHMCLDGAHLRRSRCSSART